MPVHDFSGENKKQNRHWIRMVPIISNRIALIDNQGLYYFNRVINFLIKPEYFQLIDIFKKILTHSYRDPRSGII